MKVLNSKFVCVYPYRNYDSGGNCAMAPLLDGGLWSTMKCSESMYFVCERPPGEWLSP